MSGLASPNAPIVEAWNTILFQKFCRYRHLVMGGLGEHDARLTECYPPAAGARILDIGCGFGDTSIQLARLVGEGGEVVGVDCSQNFITEAEALAKSSEVGAVKFMVRDAQCDDLQGPYDAAYSRFGTMFFSSPVAAFRNIRNALKPGGQLTMLVWRKRQDNPSFYAAQETVESFISEADKAPEEITCGPGPFSMAGADLVSDQLLAAGFSSSRFQRFDAPICVGKDIDEALNFARDLGPAGEAIRLAGATADQNKQAIEDALRATLARFQRPDGGVWADSSTWLISARA